VLTKLLTKSISYKFNRGGYYYFSRRVPSDLIVHYSYSRVVQGLRTSSPSQAKTRALIELLLPSLMSTCVGFVWLILTC